MAFKDLVADLARPFSIISTSGSAAFATGVIAWRLEDMGEAALFIGAVYAGLAGLYGFKSWEEKGKAKAQADVASAAAVAPTPPPGTALVTAAPDVDITVRDSTDSLELPPWRR